RGVTQHAESEPIDVVLDGLENRVGRDSVSLRRGARAFGEVDGAFVSHRRIRGRHPRLCDREDPAATRTSSHRNSVTPHLSSHIASGTVRLARSGLETYSHTAMRRLSSLDRVFRALADGTRRSM